MNTELYLYGFEEAVKEGAEGPHAVVELERGFILAEVRRQFTTQPLDVARVSLQLTQLLARRLHTFAP